MVTVPQFDDHQRRLAGLGGTGRIGKHGNVAQKLEELSRAVATLASAVSDLIRHSRVGPDWEHALTVSHADADVAGNVRVQHNLGYRPTRFTVVNMTSGVGAAPANWGSLKYRYAVSDEKTATFQLDQSAWTGASEMVFAVIPHPDAHISAGEVN